MNKELETLTDINTVIARDLTGKATNVERKHLKQWLNRGPENARRYKAISDATDISTRYRRYASVKEEEAWRDFKSHHIMTPKRRIAMRIARYAAAVLVIAVSAAVLHAYFASDANVVDETVRTAMRRSAETGKQRAVLTLPSGGRTVLFANTDMNDASLMSKIIRKFHQESINKRNKLSTYPDSEYWITLEDGTLVHLNGGTSLVYPESFNGNDRTVSLDGEAYFHVAHDGGRPFSVITPHGVITDYGTAFNVNTRTDKGTEVVLVEGKVGVKPSGGGETMLSPGELAYVNPQKPKTETANVDVSIYVSWNRGSFTFKGCPLEKLIDVISHWYGIHVTYEDESIRHLSFTGSINRYESALPVLNAIKIATGELEITQEGDEFVLSKKRE